MTPPAPNPTVALALSLVEAAHEVLSHQLSAPEAWRLVRSKLLDRLAAKPDDVAAMLRVLVDLGEIDLSQGFRSPMTRSLWIASSMLQWSAELADLAVVAAPKGEENA